MYENSFCMLCNSHALEREREREGEREGEKL